MLKKMFGLSKAKPNNIETKEEDKINIYYLLGRRLEEEDAEKIENLDFTNPITKAITKGFIKNLLNGENFNYSYNYISDMSTYHEIMSSALYSYNKNCHEEDNNDDLVHEALGRYSSRVFKRDMRGNLINKITVKNYNFIKDAINMLDPDNTQSMQSLRDYLIERNNDLKESVYKSMSDDMIQNVMDYCDDKKSLGLLTNIVKYAENDDMAMKAIDKISSIDQNNSSEFSNLSLVVHSSLPANNPRVIRAFVKMEKYLMGEFTYYGDIALSGDLVGIAGETFRTAAPTREQATEHYQRLVKIKDHLYNNSRVLSREFNVAKALSRKQIELEKKYNAKGEKTKYKPKQSISSSM